MKITIYIIVISIVLLIIWLLKTKKDSWYQNILTFINWISKLTIIFGVAYFLIFELPRSINEQEKQKDQRRIQLLELLSNSNTSNRVREECFIKLLQEHQIRNFSGIRLTNIKESYKSPFNFVTCFRHLSNFIMDEDTLVKIGYSSEFKRKSKIINLDKILFWNTNLQYADFSINTQKRLNHQEDWIVIDDEFPHIVYTFIFKYLTDTDLSFANLHAIKNRKWSLDECQSN
ncbi:MAG: hypothetical protein K8R79_08005 [Calditrichales bacterium]|nr:hypothetical protein [Calditrichales bacterium]